LARHQNLIKILGSKGTSHIAMTEHHRTIQNRGWASGFLSTLRWLRSGLSDVVTTWNVN